MPLWCDKYRPTSLAELDYAASQGAQLKKLADAGDLPHILFYGPPGAGKKTRVTALLRDVFGPGVEKVKLEHRSFKTPTGRAIEMTTVASTYHIEINPGDAGIYDRFVVQELIKEMAAYNPLSAAETGVSSKPWKVLLLSEVDRLTKEAQAALRRTMEKYTATCRLVLVASSLSKVIEPVRSRCLGVRVAAPTTVEIMGVLRKVAAAEGMALPEPVAAKISAQSGRNLRRALLMLETATVTSGGALSVATPIPLMDWERYAQALAQDVLREQSPRQLLACRARVYELLVNCIPADVIMKRLAAFLTAETGLGMGAGAGLPRVLPEETRHELAHWAAHYEHRLQLGSKELFHIEAFIAKAMAVIRAAPAPGAGAGAGAGAGGAMSAGSMGSGAAAAGSAGSFASASAGSGAASRPGMGAMGGAGAGR